MEKSIKEGLVKKGHIKIAGVIVGSLFLVAGVGAFMGGGALKFGVQKNDGSVDAAAVVNSQYIPQLAVIGLMRNGMDRANAVDQAINMSLMAQEAQRLFAEDASAALRTLEINALSNVYAQKRAEQISSAIDDDALKGWYEKNILEENYRRFQVRYYLTQDQRDAQDVMAKINSEKQDEKDGALKKFAKLSAEGDGFMPLRALPYESGRLISKNKAGDVVGPFLVRDGLLILKVDGVRQDARPTFESVKEDIRQQMTRERFAEDVQGLRKKAVVQVN